MQHNHSAVNRLVSATPTHVAKQSGSWFDPNTWQGNKVPDNNAKVLIKEGLSVRYDNSSDARLSTLNVQGKLAFATNKNTKMVIDTFVVSRSGKLEIGTKANPVKAGVKTEIVIADNGPINLKQDPEQLGRGLISHGDVEIHGQAKTSHLKVATDPLKGDRTLTLASKPINWRVGDKIVLTGTRYISAESDKAWEATIEDEEVTIKAINGNKITLEESLKYNHTTPRSDLKAYVANQSRNVVISSENGDATPIGQRGHAMFMHSDDIDIRYVEFKDLGRTNKRHPIDKVVNGRKNQNGRYSVHIHETGTGGDPAVLVGNVVDGSPGWGFVVHDSKAVLEQNLAHDIYGGAFVTETGNETGAFRNNISIKTGGVYDINEKSGVKTHDFARTGVGFWFAGRLFENENNVAAGSRNAGMFYMHRGSKLIDPDVKDLPFPEAARNTSDQNGQTVNVDQPPIQGFKDNEVLASGTGLHVIKNFPKQNNDLRTVLDGFKGWEIEKGTELEYTSHYSLNDFDFVGSKNARFWVNKGVDLQANTQEIVFNNMSIDGFKVGIEAHKNAPGQGVPELSDKNLTWINLKMKNNESKFKNFDLPASEWLTKADVDFRKSVKFTPSADIDLEITANDFKDEGYVQIRGTKTDSLGTVEMPFGNERLNLNYNDAKALAQKGYYTLADGRRVAVLNEYFSDRVTGKTIRMPFVVTFKEDWWTDGAPNLGKLNPSNLGGAVNVAIPKTRFQQQAGPIIPTKPTLPTKPTIPPTKPPIEPPTKPTEPTEPPTEPPTKPTGPTGPTTGPEPTLLQAIASYDFAAGSGTRVQDTSTAGRNNSGRLTTGASWTEEGVKGNGLQLNGSGRVAVRNSSDINTQIHGQRSLSFWFKADEIMGGSGKQVLYEEGGSGRGLNAYLSGDDLYVSGWNRPGKESGWKGSNVKAAGSIKAGQWYHVAVVLNGDETVSNNALTAYLDGEKVGSTEGSQLWAHGNAIALGNIGGNTRFHDGIGSGSQGLSGSLDEFNIYNQALSSEQVKDLHALFA